MARLYLSAQTETLNSLWTLIKSIAVKIAWITAIVFCAQMPAPLLTNVTSAEPNTKHGFPHLPAIPYNYAITGLPAHLVIPSATHAATQYENKAQFNHLATLGRVLFYDKDLSQNSLVSCSSCHKQEKGFDDPSRFSIGFKGRITSRSAMGLTNARFNFSGRYFWDERAKSLEDQVLMPFIDPVEMGLEPGELVVRVREKSYYPKLFKNAFGNDAITQGKIAAALAGFINSLISFNSPYDKARPAVSSPEQDFPAFSIGQNRGKSIFFNNVENGGAGCITCHHTEFFISLAAGSSNGLDLTTNTDQGIGAINRDKNDLGKFRPPSLKNIAIRAPFMHDGRFDTLEKVIDHYSSGIKNHPNLGEVLQDSTGKPRKFDFSENDKKALVSFLQTLTDQQIINDPKFSNPFQ